MLSPQTKLKGLSNIGPTIAARLEVIGIRTIADLRQAGGPAGAFKLLAASNQGRSLPVCYYLYSLQGALEGKHWDAISDETKQALLHEIGRGNRLRRSP